MDDVTSVLAAAAAEEPGSGPVGPPLAGTLILIGLTLAMVFLYRSMRKQLKRIDFNPEGQTDEERMAGPQVRRNGGAARRPHPADLGEAPPHEAGTNGHQQP